MAELQLSDHSSSDIDWVPVASSSSVAATFYEQVDTANDAAAIHESIPHSSQEDDTPVVPTSDEHTKAADNTTNQASREEGAPAGSKACFHNSPWSSEPSSPFLSAHSDTLPLLEYPGVLTPTTNENSSTPDTTSHIVMIDPTTTTASTRRPDVPHPDAPLSEVHDYLIAFIVDTLYRLENNPLEDAEAQASDYVAKFESDFERQPSTGLNAAGYLYSCSKEGLVGIFSNDNPEPPRIVRRVCNELYLSLLYSKYGKVCQATSSSRIRPDADQPSQNSSKWRPFLDFGSYCTLLAVVFNLGALFLVNEPTTMLSWSLVLSTVFHLSLKRMFEYWSSKEGLADPKTPE
ncbi:MAG: hypothetical protein Q9199_004147 [Rusavskia elegans]